MTLTINDNGNTIMGKLAGRLDTIASKQMEKDMLPLMDNADKHIVIDCKSLEYICSMGLRLLLTLRKKAIAEGGKVTIANVPDQISQIFAITGFDKLFDFE